MHETFDLQDSSAECIATDDPRLTFDGGWYLMVPPLSEPQAPLSHWAIYLSFDTAEPCERERARVAEWDAKNKDAGIHLTHHARSGDLQYEGTLAQCVASDDPRLKEGR